MGDSDEAAVTTPYGIVVRATVSQKLASDIGARRCEPLPGTTLIVVDIIDQSQLHGVLGWLQDRNIDIESVNPM